VQALPGGSGVSIFKFVLVYTGMGVSIYKNLSVCTNMGASIYRHMSVYTNMGVSIYGVHVAVASRTSRTRCRLCLSGDTTPCRTTGVTSLWSSYTGLYPQSRAAIRVAGALGVSIQGNLAHKKTSTSLGPPYDPRHRPTEGS
jgi:hypothetical protein